jgi:hypothetical protein
LFAEGAWVNGRDGKEDRFFGNAPALLSGGKVSAAGFAGVDGTTGRKVSMAFDEV